MQEVNVHIGVFGREYLYNYHIANLTEGIITRANESGEKLIWVIPNFSTKVHDHAESWLKYKGQTVERVDVNEILSSIDMGIVFWDNKNEGVLEVSRMMASKNLGVYLVDDKPEMSITSW